MQALTVNLSDLYSKINSYEVQMDSGFTNKESGEHVYFSSKNLRLMLLYVMQRYFGVSDSFHIIDDMPEATDEKDDLVISLSDLRDLIDGSASSGMYFTNDKAILLDRLPLLILDDVQISKEIDNSLANILDAMRTKMLAIMPELTDDELMTKAPKFIYIGEIEDYLVYRDLNAALSSEYKIVLIYYNLKGFEQNKQTIEYEQMRVQFSHILYGYSDSEVYTFSAKDRFIQMFAGKYYRGGATLESSDIQMRSVKQKFFQILEMYEWVMESPYKVFMFSTDVWELEVDISFYAALILAQQSKHIKVLLRSSAQYDRLMAEIVNLPFADFYSRFRNVYATYKPNTLRLLANNMGRQSIALVRDVNMNLKFSGVSLNNLSEMIKRLDSGEFTIALDSNTTDTTNLDILSNSDFNRYNAAGFKIRPINVFDALYRVYSGGNGEVPVDREFEGYLYMVCRLMDQLLHNYEKFSTIRDLACFQVSDNSGNLQNKIYIGIGTIQPEAVCDILTLSDEGSIVRDIRYAGDMLDINAIDDIDSLRFRCGIDSDVQVGILDKIKDIYESAKLELPDCLETLDQSRIQPLSGFSAFMAMVHSAGVTTHVSLVQDIYNLMQDKAYASGGSLRKMHDSKLAPIYFGLALTRNWYAYKYITPYVLRATTSFGYRQVQEKDSPVNVFGGITLDTNSNMWLYPQLFQHNRPVAGSEGR